MGLSPKSDPALSETVRIDAQNAAELYGVTPPKTAEALERLKRSGVRPFVARVTDSDVKGGRIEWEVKKRPGSGSATARPALEPRPPSAPRPATASSGRPGGRPSSSKKRATATPHVYLRVPCNCVSCMVKEFRLVSAVGPTIFLRKRPQELLRDEQLERRRIVQLIQMARRQEREESAARIQGAWRAFLARGLLAVTRERHWAAVTIQRHFRGYLDRQFAAWYRKVMTAAARRLQKAWRAYRFSTVLIKQRRAKKIQAVFRAFRTRRAVRSKFRRETLAAIIIQANWRKFAARRRFLEYWTSGTAASRVVQSYFRMFRLRRPFLWYFHDRISAAVSLQALARRWLLFRALARERQARLNAVLVLQRFYRRHKYRIRRSQRRKRQHRSAALIQRTWKFFHVRRKYWEIWRHAMTCAIKIEAAWKAARVRAAYRVRRESHRREQARLQREHRAATAVQSFARGRQLRRWFERVLLAVPRMQRALRLFAARRRVQRRRDEQRGHIREIVGNQMRELLRVVYLPDLWVPAPLMEVDCRRALEALAALKRPIRFLYLRYSTAGVPSPDKAFKLTKPMYVKFLKDLRLPDAVVNAMPDFNTYLRDPPPSHTITRYLKGIAVEKRPKSAVTAESDGSIGLDEFVEAVVRLALVRSPDEPGAVRALLGPAGKVVAALSAARRRAFVLSRVGSTAAKIERLGREALVPLYEDALRGVPVEVNIADPELKVVVEKYSPKLRSLFRTYSSRIGGGEPGSNKTISAREFLLMLKELRMIDAGLSYSRALESFIYSNAAELEAYLSTDAIGAALLDKMEMVFIEFCAGLARCAAGPISTGGRRGSVALSAPPVDPSGRRNSGAAAAPPPTDVLVKQLDRFFSRLTSSV